MKQIFAVFTGLMLVGSVAFAQDAATEERLNKLQNALETLQASNVELQKKISELTKELQEVREQSAKPAGNFAAAEDVKQLAEKLKEVDRKRADDRDLILKEIEKLGKTITTTANRPRANTDSPKPKASDVPDKGYEYEIQSGDTLSTIVAAYREQGVKVTVDQVVKANPGLNPNALRVGKKIFIPAP
jgi:Tfp pilus assembly protein FimV